MSEFMIEFSNWGLSGFRMVLSVMASTKLAGCLFYVLFFPGVMMLRWRELWCSYPLHPPRCEITLGCVQEGSCWGYIIGTFGSFIVNFGVGDVGMMRTGAAVWKSYES